MIGETKADDTKRISSAIFQKSSTVGKGNDLVLAAVKTRRVEYKCLIRAYSTRPVGCVVVFAQADKEERKCLMCDWPADSDVIARFVCILNVDLWQRRGPMLSLLRLSCLQPYQLRFLPRFSYVLPQQQSRKMTAKTIAVLDESELKDGEL